MKGLKVASNDEKDNQGNSNGGTSASKADENSPKTRDAAPVAATGAVMLAAFALVVAMRKRRQLTDWGRSKIEFYYVPKVERRTEK